MTNEDKIAKETLHKYLSNSSVEINQKTFYDISLDLFKIAYRAGYAKGSADSTTIRSKNDDDNHNYGTTHTNTFI